MRGKRRETGKPGRAASDLGFAAGFVARVLSTPLPSVLPMKVREFHHWQQTARDVHDATRLSFE